MAKVSFGNFPVQTTEFVIPERMEDWRLTVWAVPPPNVQWSQTTSVGGSVERPARLMNRFELIRVSFVRPQLMLTLLNVMFVPPITWTPSWCIPGALPRQRIEPPPIDR